MTRHAVPKPLLAGMLLLVLGIGMASVGVLGALQIIPLSSLSPAAPSLSLSVYTNVAPGSQNTLHVSLENVADCSGELVRVSIDGGADVMLVLTALDTAPAAPRGSAQLKFDSGSVGSHTISVRWSNATHEASSTIGYSVVSSPNPSETGSASQASALSIALIAAGAVISALGCGIFALRRLA